ncbi:MAG TPA: TadE/TadG family type IV pilus assembly protein [Terriglobia bacterium]|nr:TadE/TadG family type IV pilus assembly protein [Terriglobia bacterium]
MTVSRKSHRKAGESGVTVLEGALFIIAFFMLIFGVIELGRFLSMRQVLTNAAREGARFAIAPLTQTNTLPSESEVVARVNVFLNAASVTGATITTMCPVAATETCTSKDVSMSVTTGLVTTEYTKVTVTKPYSVITVPGFFNALNITLKGEALMRRETSE